MNPALRSRPRSLSLRANRSGDEAAPRVPDRMDTSSQRPATAFHGCRSGKTADRAPTDAWSSSRTSALPEPLRTPASVAEQEPVESPVGGSTSASSRAGGGSPRNFPTAMTTDGGQNLRGALSQALRDLSLRGTFGDGRVVTSRSSPFRRYPNRRGAARSSTSARWSPGAGRSWPSRAAATSRNPTATCRRGRSSAPRSTRSRPTACAPSAWRSWANQARCGGGPSSVAHLNCPNGDNRARAPSRPRRAAPSGS
jgi:hypothetical protein